MDGGESHSGRWVLLKGRLIASLFSVFVMALTGMCWTGLHTTVGRIIISHALPNSPLTFGSNQNILLLGLDSRLDQNGNPLPQEMYDALHAGDETSGGYNANVLIVVHLSADDGPITAVSIPRDDYVELPGCPGSVCKGKVKQAYGLAYQQSLDAQAARSGAGATDLGAREQAAREAGRKAEIGTVNTMLGIEIDHFVEVTLGAFFQLAKVVQPITVCLNADTSDDYSGADFHQGVQRIDAAQAMAFVRQRRDADDESFTDFDRTRRQQAFLVSLVKAARDGGSLSSPRALRGLLQVARDNVAVDAGLDLVGVAAHASDLTRRPMSLYTLPISGFGHDGNGSDVNIVDLPEIRRIVQERFAADAPAAPDRPGAATPPALTEPAVLDVVNATARDGLAAALEGVFTGRGFTRGRSSTAAAHQDESTVEYGPGAADAAKVLADQLHLSATGSDTVAPGTVRLTVGARFPADDYLGHPASAPDPAAASGTVTAVAATGSGTSAPAPTDLSQMTATAIPCVK
jgi:LCP family protein required for cell wall assembly